MRSTELRGVPCTDCQAGRNTGHDHPECRWDHVGESGEHEGHWLSSDDSQDVWCATCQRWLTDAEADQAWPVDLDQEV